MPLNANRPAGFQLALGAIREAAREKLLELLGACGSEEEAAAVLAGMILYQEVAAKHVERIVDEAAALPPSGCVSHVRTSADLLLTADKEALQQIGHEYGLFE